MFKVICIENKAQHEEAEDVLELTIGQEYTVIDCIRSCGIYGYILKELKPKGGYIAFDALLFVRIDGQSDMKITEERTAAESDDLDKEWSRIVHEYETA